MGFFALLVSNQVKLLSDKMKTDLSAQANSAQKMIELKNEMEKRESEYIDLEVILWIINYSFCLVFSSQILAKFKSNIQ